ncbi:MAG: caspase family protein, partial [Sandaracinaceae bacterium]|nr:caspase family protein [Sandaracinaceae bacterium]
MAHQRAHRRVGVQAAQLAIEEHHGLRQALQRAQCRDRGGVGRHGHVRQRGRPPVDGARVGQAHGCTDRAATPRAVVRERAAPVLAVFAGRCARVASAPRNAFPWRVKSRRDPTATGARMSLFEHGYALIVGVGGDLQASVADATDLASVLKDPLRAAYKAENVILLTEAAATRDGVVAGLHRLRDMTKADPQATAVIYFSGHGIVVGEKTPTPKYFLATHGHDFDRPAETCLSDEDFSKAIDEVLAQKKIVFLDCCHAAGIPKSKGDGAVETALPKKTLQQLTGGEGTVVVASCGHKQKSWEYPGSRNSLFTEVLLEELGVGDETDGLAYMFGVLNEVTKRVRARGGDKYPQEPLVAYAKGLTNFPICRGKWGAKGGVGQPAGTAPKKSKGADTARSVFVSYAQADKAYGEELVRTLRTYERAGVFRLIPHDVDPGKVVELEVRRKVEEAGVIVCLLSADYFAD